MKNLFKFIILSVLITVVLISGSGILTAEKEKSRESGWVSLFDGKTLKGWGNPYTWGEAKVVDNEIHLSAEKKFFLCTEKQYADFIFEAEIRLPDEKGKCNSGIMFRCHKKKNKVTGYQAEVDNTEREWSGGLYDEGRRKWFINPIKKDDANVEAFLKKARGVYKQNEWNKYRIHCEGEKIKIYVNGVLTTDVSDGMDSQGYIAIQHHGEKGGNMYRFRNIRIKEIKEADQGKPPKENFKWKKSKKK